MGSSGLPAQRSSNPLHVQPVPALAAGIAPERAEFLLPARHSRGGPQFFQTGRDGTPLGMARLDLRCLFWHAIPDNFLFSFQAPPSTCRDWGEKLVERPRCLSTRAVLLGGTLCQRFPSPLTLSERAANVRWKRHILRRRARLCQVAASPFASVFSTGNIPVSLEARTAVSTRYPSAPLSSTGVACDEDVF